MIRCGKILAGAILLSLCLLLCPAGAWAQPLGFGSQQQQVKFPEYKALCNPAGRFVFGQISDSGKDKFMLDTFTGRLWQIAETGDLGMHLRPVLFRMGDGKCTPIPEDLPEAAPEEVKK
jgi:hypothetical protein